MEAEAASFNTEMDSILLGSTSPNLATTPSININGLLSPKVPIPLILICASEPGTPLN